MKQAELAGYIEHTNLQPFATQKEIEKLCEEAVEYGFKAVCVNPSFVSFAASCLDGQSPFVVSVVGFPLGASQTSTKAHEAKEAVSHGASEIDMVINMGALKAKDYQLVYEDIKQVVEASSQFPVKVILETGLLTREEKAIAAALAKAAGAAFVKTSTGFFEKKATIEDVAFLKEVIGHDMEVKASGGIKTFEEAQNFIKAGASRLGTSQSIQIIKEKKTGEKS